MKTKAVYAFIVLNFLLSTCYAQDTLLKGGITKIPDMIFGLWRVKSVRIDTDSPATFKANGLDMWNISQTGNVLILSNPFSGASAEVKIDRAEQNKIIFTKTGNYGGKELSDTVSIELTEKTFTGTDELKLNTKSDVDGRIIKTETAKYSIKGEKLTW